MKEIKLKKYKRVPISIEKAIIDRSKRKTPISEKAPKRIAKKTVLELLELEDWFNAIDPNYWIEEEKSKPKPVEDIKSLYIRTGITKLI